jgi:hypothetical protein
MRESLVNRAAVERLFLIAGAVQAGIVDALAARELLSAADVATVAGTDGRATLVVLEALVAEGVVDRIGPAPEPPVPEPPGAPAKAEQGEAGGAASPVGPASGPGHEETFYRLTPLGKSHLVDPGPDLERWSLLHQARKSAGWLELADVIRTGTPPTRDAARRSCRSAPSKRTSKSRPTSSTVSAWRAILSSARLQI